MSKDEAVSRDEAMSLFSNKPSPSNTTVLEELRLDLEKAWSTCIAGMAKNDCALIAAVNTTREQIAEFLKDITERI